MKFLIAIVLLTSSVYAMKCDFSRPIEVEYLDTEASTNQVFAIGDMDGSRFSLMLDINAKIDNSVVVEFGVDENSDAVLSQDEVGLSLGWRCGEVFLDDRISNLFEARTVEAGRHNFKWSFRVPKVGWQEYLTIEDGDFEVLGESRSGFLMNPSWNLVRIVFRNGSSEDVNISYSRFNIPFVIRLR